MKNCLKFCMMAALLLAAMGSVTAAIVPIHIKKASGMPNTAHLYFFAGTSHLGGINFATASTSSSRAITFDVDGYAVFNLDNLGWTNLSMIVIWDGSGQSPDIGGGIENGTYVYFYDNGDWSHYYRYDESNSSDKWPTTAASGNADAIPTRVYQGDHHEVSPGYLDLEFEIQVWPTWAGQWFKHMHVNSSSWDLTTDVVYGDWAWDDANNDGIYNTGMGDNAWMHVSPTRTWSSQFKTVGTRYWGVQMNYGDRIWAWHTRGSSTWQSMLTRGELTSTNSNLAKVQVDSVPQPTNLKYGGTKGAVLYWTHARKQILPAGVTRGSTHPKKSLPGFNLDDGAFPFNVGVFKLHGLNGQNKNLTWTPTAGQRWDAVNTISAFPMSISGDWEYKGFLYGCSYGDPLGTAPNSYLALDKTYSPKQQGGPGIYRVYSENYGYYSRPIVIGYFDLSTDLYDLNGETPNVDKVFFKYEQPENNHFFLLSLPFKITSLYDPKGEAITLATSTTDATAKVHLRRYNGTARAIEADQTSPVVASPTGWEVITVVDSSNPLEPGGYAIWINEDKMAGSTAEKKELIFEGPGQKIDFNRKTSKSAKYPTHTSGRVVQNGWDLVGTPCYAWTIFKPSAGQKCWVWDAEHNTYNPAGVAAPFWIEPFSAFFVKMGTSANTALEFDNTYSGIVDDLTRNRPDLPGVAGAPAANSGSGMELLTIRLNDYYKTYISFNEEALADYDDWYDMVYMPSMVSTVPQLYTFKGTEPLSLNTIPGTTKINLGMHIPAAGEYTLKWDNSIVSCNTSLIDYATGQVINMAAESEYTFTAYAAEDVSDRFMVDALRVTTGIVQSAGEVKVYSDHNSIVIEGMNQPTAVSIYDVTGRAIVNKTVSNSFRIPAQQGIYVVNVGDKRVKLIMN